jgi:hypothetical protein
MGSHWSTILRFPFPRRFHLLKRSWPTFVLALQTLFPGLWTDRRFLQFRLLRAYSEETHRDVVCLFMNPERVDYYLRAPRIQVIW